MVCLFALILCINRVWLRFDGLFRLFYYYILIVCDYGLMVCLIALITYINRV